MQTQTGPPRTPSAQASWLGAWLTAVALSGLGLLAWRAFGGKVGFPPLDLFGGITQLLGVPGVFRLLHEVFGVGQGGKIFAFFFLALLWLGGLTLLGRLQPFTAALGLTLMLLFFMHWTDAALYAGAFWLLRHALESALRTGRTGDPNRRAVVAALGGGSALLVGGGMLNLFRGVSTSTAVGAGEALPGGVTPVEDFYYVSKNLQAFDPRLDGARWRLRVGGLVQREQTFTLDDLKKLPSKTVELTLSCISNPVGGPLISNGVWTGCSVADLLRKVGVRGGAKYIVWRAADGYQESLPLGQAFEEGVLLVYDLNGEPLSARHGFPLRVLIPGRYGMKQPRWITEISLSARDVPGYWARRDWSKTARVELMSRIDVPAGRGAVVRAGQPTTIGGIAFYGARPITRVEVSTDGGKSWRAARLETPRSRYAWTRWSLAWTPAAGSHELTVRAYSGATVQTAREQGALPEGATGLHHFSVNAS